MDTFYVGTKTTTGAIEKINFVAATRHKKILIKNCFVIDVYIRKMGMRGGII